MGDYYLQAWYTRLSSRVAEQLKTKILGDQEIPGKCPNPIEYQSSAQSPHQNESFPNTSRRPLKNRN